MSVPDRNTPTLSASQGQSKPVRISKPHTSGEKSYSRGIRISKVSKASSVVDIAVSDERCERSGGRARPASWNEPTVGCGCNSDDGAVDKDLSLGSGHCGQAQDKLALMLIKDNM
jgi:hypothetical protein